MRDLEEARYKVLREAATLALSCLNERERMMIIFYYWRCSNTDTLGEHAGISGQRVRQIWPRLHQKMLVRLMVAGVGDMVLDALRS